MTCDHNQYTMFSHTYKVCVNPSHCNYLAHDSVTNTKTCTRCGFIQTENVDGEQAEATGWLSPETDRPF